MLGMPVSAPIRNISQSDPEGVPKTLCKPLHGEPPLAPGCP